MKANKRKQLLLVFEEAEDVLLVGKERENQLIEELLSINSYKSFSF